MILKDNGEYYIELNDVINNSEFTEEDLVGILGEKIDYVLKNMSSKVYRIMYGAYNGWEQEQQKKELQYIINNDISKQDVICDAIIEYARGAMYSGMDMQDYMPSSSIEERMKNKAAYPPMVKDILYSGGLWIIAEIMADDENKAV